MKLHLPITLLTAVLATFIALPAHAVEAPKGYTTTYLNSPGTLENYSSLTAEDYMAFILQSSHEITPTGADYWTSSTPLVSGGNVFFGSENSYSPVALSFKGGNGPAFYNQSSLTFDTLSKLAFSTIEGESAAIDLGYGGTLTISNVNDGQSETVDVLFEDIKNTDSSGGAICAYYGDVTISKNGDVTFSGNSSYEAGAIYADSLTISDNGDVSFSGNSADSYGGAIYADYDVTISHNSAVSFSGNSADSSSGAIYARLVTISDNGAVSFSDNSADSSGGAIYAGFVTISDNGDVSFSGNSAKASSNYSSGGGAIYADYDVTISDNSAVSFSDNSISSETSAPGGAIYARDVTINNNGDVTFSGNYASSSSSASTFGGAICASDVSISNNGDVAFSENYVVSPSARGGSIYAIDVSISNNGDIAFSGNYVASSNVEDDSTYGGAIYADYGVTISNNGDVAFSGNYASSSHNASSSSLGGAIYARYDVTISNNGAVAFSGNYASSSYDSSYASPSTYAPTTYGGAIYAYSGVVTISNNRDVAFSENFATTFYNASTSSYGGAIYAGFVTISNNGAVAFSGNYASSSSSASTYGGAIYASDVTISNNGDVAFSGNYASSLCYFHTTSSGGAIEANRVTISNNGAVTFSGNYASSLYSSSSSSSIALGGAIFTDEGVSIQGNDSALFEKNYERIWHSNGSRENIYRLRSIYNRYGGDIILSAKTGGNITFYDSVYSSGDSYFNSDYTDTDGNTQRAGGDIIFSGKYAEAHLTEIMAAYKEFRSATAEEILNSQTNEIGGNVYVNSGSVQIVDGAVLKVGGDTVSIAEGSDATLAISDAELVAKKAKVEIGSSATLQLSNGASITADEINIKSGATLALGDIAITTTISDTMVAAYRLSSLNIIDADLTFAAGSSLVTDGTGISMTKDSVLTFMATSEGEKVNLVFTLGTEYTEDSLVQLFSNVDIVKFLMDGEEVDSSTTLLASDFFAGAGINENTTLHYDSTTNAVYLQGVSNVVPEPATATLSLLALAALAARRRRK
ncbi:MAG: hypothetical protein IKJ58_09915 [Akkermansia sp.]|nr:hypothetical protein [Akkermansia sp.]